MTNGASRSHSEPLQAEAEDLPLAPRYVTCDWGRDVDKL